MIIIENLIHNGEAVTLSIGGVGLHGLLFDDRETKSRWLNLLAGCDVPVEGSVLLERKALRRPTAEQKKFIGYVPASVALYEDMTVLELLDFMGEAKGVDPDKRAKQIKEAVELMGLGSVSNRLIGTLSAAHRRRIVFAQAVLGNPTVIVVDEPYLDSNAEERRDVEALLEMLGRHKPIVLGSTERDDLSACSDVTAIGMGGVRLLDLNREEVAETLAVEEENKEDEE